MDARAIARHLERRFESAGFVVGGPTPLALAHPAFADCTIDTSFAIYDPTLTEEKKGKVTGDRNRGFLAVVGVVPKTRQVVYEARDDETLRMIEALLENA